VAEEGNVLHDDGVGVVFRGDLILIVYQKPARLHRTRWLFDRVDEFVGRSPDGVVAFMLVLPTADLPDGPTRAENHVRLRKLGNGIRRLVTTPVGDALWFRLVRTVMRAMSIFQGQSKVHFVCETIREGVQKTLEAAGPKTPARAQVLEDLGAIHRALGLKMVGGAAPRPAVSSR
jgi:hypothetical protein